MMRGWEPQRMTCSWDVLRDRQKDVRDISPQAKAQGLVLQCRGGSCIYKY